MKQQFKVSQEELHIAQQQLQTCVTVVSRFNKSCMNLKRDYYECPASKLSSAAGSLTKKW